LKTSIGVLGLMLLLGLPGFAQQRDLDLVLAGGRVMDPETGLDAVRHVGIRGGQIVAVSTQPLDARLRATGRKFDLAGLVVSPGFIDLHAHGQSARSNEFQAHDGVTTALELEWGYPLVGRWLDSRAGKALVHYGASVAHGHVRTLAMSDLAPRAILEMEQALSREDIEAILPRTGTARMEGFLRALADEHLPALRERLEKGLSEGALGIGMALQYYPGAGRGEVFRVYQFAAEKAVPIFTHVRSMSVDAVQEAVANAAATGASLHIVHLNSSTLGQIGVALDLIGGAQRRSNDVSTEAYPYTAASTGIQSTLFDPGWQQRLGIDFGDLQWQETRERLSAETFAKYREKGGAVIMHMMKEEWIEQALRSPFVMIASDGMPYSPGAHPRSAGTFSRVLGRYVRERGTLSLMDALRKMTLMPARRLESIAPAMRKKGRVQEGADADLTLFDPKRITDTAKFERDLSFSEGIRHVIVAGTVIIRDGVTVPGVFPGRPVLGRYHTRP
jgi:dihydroorotase